MSTAAMEDLEAKAKIWLNENGAKINIEHARTISGSELRDDAKQSTYYAISIWYYDIANGVEEAPGRVVLTQVS